MQVRVLTVFLVFFLVVTSSAWAGPWEDAYEQYNSGNLAKAHAIWLSDAKKGNSNSQFSVGYMYDNGQGVPQDYKEAAKWYRQSAEQGNSLAQFNLGVMYDDGQGVPQDYKEALKWYRLAAEQGHRNAQNNLGVLYRNGQGVSQDDREAVHLFRQAAENGNNSGWSNLAFMYEHGRGGLEKNLEIALNLYAKADGDWAKQNYNRLSKELSCAKSAKTELFGVKLLCADRDALMTAAKKAGARVKNENKNNWGDSYFTSDILKGSSVLAINYTYDDKFAYAEYTFPSSMDSGQVTKIRAMVISKYGQPDSSSGNPGLGEVTYKWNLEDGIEIKVWRGWPNTTTYLKYFHPENYQAMIAKQEELRRKKEQENYRAQSNAF